MHEGALGEFEGPHPVVADRNLARRRAVERVCERAACAASGSSSGSGTSARAAPERAVRTRRCARRSPRRPTGPSRARSRAPSSAPCGRRRGGPRRRRPSRRGRARRPAPARSPARKPIAPRSVSSPPPRYAARSKSCTPRLTRTPLAHGFDGPTRRRSMATTVSSRMSLASVRTTGLNRSECPTKSRAPGRAAALAARASPADAHTGFSTNTCRPAASPRATIAACDSIGVATMTTSARLSASASLPRRAIPSGVAARRPGVVGADDLEAVRERPEHPGVALPHRAEADEGHLVTSRRPSAHSTLVRCALHATFRRRPRRAQKRSPRAARSSYAPSRPRRRGFERMPTARRPSKGERRRLLRGRRSI